MSRSASFSELHPAGDIRRDEGSSTNTEADVMRIPETTILTVAADAVAAASAALGGLLAFAPRTGGQWLGLARTGVERKQVLGATDLGLGVAIIAGRSTRWRWSVVAARSLLHLEFAHQYARNGRPLGATAMCALLAIDAGIAVGLYTVRSDTDR